MIFFFNPAILSAFGFFLILIPPYYSFHPCVLLASRVSCLGLFFFPSLGKCLRFFLCVNTCLLSVVLLDSVGSCLRAHTLLSPHSWTDLGMRTHMHARSAHRCTPTCTYTMPLSDPSLLLMEITPTATSSATVSIPASSWFLEGVIQVGRKSEGEPELASHL